MTRLNPTLRRTISGRVLGWNGHRVESVDGVSFRSICGWDVPKTDDVTLLCGDPAPRCRGCQDVLRREAEPTTVDRAQCAKAALREALRSLTRNPDATGTWIDSAICHLDAIIAADIGLRVPGSTDAIAGELLKIADPAMRDAALAALARIRGERG